MLESPTMETNMSESPMRENTVPEIAGKSHDGEDRNGESTPKVPRWTTQDGESHYGPFGTVSS